MVLLRIICSFCLQSTLVANNYNFRLVMVLLGPAIANSQPGENKKMTKNSFENQSFFVIFLFSAAPLKHCLRRAVITSLKIKVFVTHYLSAQKLHIILRSTASFRKQRIIKSRNFAVLDILTQP